MDRFSDIDSGITGKAGGGFSGNRPPRRPGSSLGEGSDAFGGRVPPQNIEAEIAVLGAMMLGERGAVERASEMITRDDFYRDAHGQIFDAMLHLAEKDEPVDIITLKDELGRRGYLDNIGGIGYLMQLGEFVPTTANLQYHAQIVREKAILRRLIEAASRIAGMAYGEVDEVDTVVDMAERTIFEVARKRSAQGFMPLRPLLNEAFEQVDVAYHEKGMVTGLDTGFEDLNYMTSGFQDGDLIILAARPSMGKCVKWDNLIIDPATGDRITIKEAVECKQATVLRIGEDGAVGASSVSHWVDSGVKPCWRVTTKTGRFVEVTGHHPFLTVDGWTPLHDIKPGQHIAVPSLVDINPDTIVKDNPKKDIAALVKSTEYPLRYQPGVAKVFSDLQNLKDKVVFEKIDQASELYNDIAIYGFGSDIWALSRNNLVKFLRKLLTDSYRVYATSELGIKAFAYGEGIARDIHHAFLRLGIISRFGRWSNRKWYVQIIEPDSVDLFLQTIGNLGGKIKPLTNEERKMRGKFSNQVPRSIWRYIKSCLFERGWSMYELGRRAGEDVDVAHYNPRSTAPISRERLARFAEVLDDDHLRRVASPSIYWDEIVSIEPIGEHQVYDLSVPDGANFVAQDIFVHNTSLAVGIGQNVALKQGPNGERKVVALFSMEMSREQLVQRMICSEARVDAHKLRTGFLQDDDWDRLAGAIQRLWDANIYIDDTTDMGPLEMRAKCRRLRAEQGLDLVIVDYLQLMRGSGRSNSNRNEEITEISRGLKNIAREMKVPVIALAQLSRAVERREDKRPMLSDLRDSGSIEAEADLVSFIYRPAYYERKQEIRADDGSQGDGDNNNNRPGEYDGEEAEVIIAKHRNGPVGTVKVSFLARFARFDNLANRDDNPF